MNTVILSGRLTSKPELRSTEKGKKICNFTLAVRRSKSDEADFIDCSCFDTQAENLCKYQDKGNLILLTGRIKDSKWVDTNGQNRRRTMIEASTIEYASLPQTSAYEAKNDQKEAYKNMGEKVKADYDLPF